MLYPQNGDRILAIDFVTSLHPKYTVQPVQQNKQNTTKKTKRVVQQAHIPHTALKAFHDNL